MRTSIICSGDEVRDLLSKGEVGIKRVVQPQPTKIVTDWSFDAEVGDIVMYRGRPVRLTESRGRNKRDAGELTPKDVPCPYGQPGDRLWVRETWAGFVPCGLASTYYPMGIIKLEPIGSSVFCREIVYKADGDDVTQDHPNAATSRWRSPIHMPRWASRLTVENMSTKIVCEDGIYKWEHVFKRVDK